MSASPREQLGQRSGRRTLATTGVDSASTGPLSFVGRAGRLTRPKLSCPRIKKSEPRGATPYSPWSISASVPQSPTRTTSTTTSSSAGTGSGTSRGLRRAPRRYGRPRATRRLHARSRRARGRGGRRHDHRRLGAGDDRGGAFRGRESRGRGRPRGPVRRRCVTRRAAAGPLDPRHPELRAVGVPALRERPTRDPSRHHSCSGWCGAMKDLYKLARTLVWVAFFGALYQELRKPDAERTWHGKVAGVIPYDFRLPTVERLRRAYWDPESEVIFSDHVFGVGWAVNIPVAARRLAALVDQYADASRSLRAGRSPARRSSSPESE